jgi:hypothetical protein
MINFDDDSVIIALFKSFAMELIVSFFLSLIDYCLICFFNRKFKYNL